MLPENELKELESVRKKSKDKALKPEDVLAFAERHTDAAIRRHFTWDDTEAARKQRLTEARELIVQVKVEILPREEKEVRYYVSVPSDRTNGNGYRPVREVVENSVQRCEMIDDAFNTLSRIRRQYHYLPELGGFFDKLDGLVESERRKFKTAAA